MNLEQTIKDKAAAILKARSFLKSGDIELARVEFARAADLEERIVSARLVEDNPDFAIHLLSAAWCWLNAGHRQRAVKAALRLLEGNVTIPIPDSLKAEAARCLQAAYDGLRKIPAGTIKYQIQANKISVARFTQALPAALVAPTRQPHPILLAEEKLEPIS